MEKQPVLIVFDVDGTLAKAGTAPDQDADQATWETYLSSLQPERNMVAIVQHYLKMTNVELMFCTSRPKSLFRVTWQWLNKTLGLAASGKRASLVCRPDDEPSSHVSAGKVSEVVQAIRRVGSRPAEAFIYDDDLQNLRLYESLRPLVATLRLFKVEAGVASEWSL